MLYVYYTQHAPGDIAAFTHERATCRRTASFRPSSFAPAAGVVGLVLAAIFAAAMSTLSSSLNSSSAAAVNDFYIPATGSRRRQPPLSQRVAAADRRLRRAIQIAVAIVAISLSSRVVG